MDDGFGAGMVEDMLSLQFNDGCGGGRSRKDTAWRGFEVWLRDRVGGRSVERALCWAGVCLFAHAACRRCRPFHAASPALRAPIAPCWRHS